MKKTMVLMAMTTALVSACVDQDDVQSVVVGQGDDVSDDGESMGGPVSPTAERCSVVSLGVGSSNGLVNHGGESMDESTGEPTFVVLGAAKVYGYNQFIDVELRGCLYGGTIRSITPEFFGENGQEVFPRRAMDMFSVEVAQDGAVTVYARMSLVSSEGLRRISLYLYDRESERGSNRLEVDIEVPVFLSAGEICGDFGRVCAVGLVCNGESICEAL